MPIEEHFSAGGVVYRRACERLDVIVCGRRDPPMWGLPKGTPDPGESAEQTALREVREETGLEVELGESLGEIEYWFHKPGARVHKRVRFYLMRPTGGRTEDHDPEFDLVEWVPGDEAMRMLTYGSEKDILREALRRIAAP